MKGKRQKDGPDKIQAKIAEVERLAKLSEERRVKYLRLATRADKQTADLERRRNALLTRLDQARKDVTARAFTFETK